MQGPETN